jgi:hypothetical protein
MLVDRLDDTATRVAGVGKAIGTGMIIGSPFSFVLVDRLVDTTTGVAGAGKVIGIGMMTCSPFSFVLVDRLVDTATGVTVGSAPGATVIMIGTTVMVPLELVVVVSTTIGIGVVAPEGICT